MQRSLHATFMGGAVVFPGGRIEPGDAEWEEALAAPPPEGAPWSDAEGRAARIAACREALEEVGVIPLAGSPVGPDVVERLRAAAAAGGASLRAALAGAGLSLDVGGLVPFARWVTPEAEPKRFDARFFVALAPSGQLARSDQREAVRAMWATPRDLLRRFDEGELTLFPPTHRTLCQLAEAAGAEEAIESARAACLEVICPRFALEDGVPVLALPGDPIHEIPRARVAGPSRFVLRGERWRAEHAPGFRD